MMKPTQPRRGAKLGGATAGIDRRSLLAASAMVLAARGVGSASAATEIVIVDGWVLSPDDLVAPVRAG
jgi:hypothetical protein